MPIGFWWRRNRVAPPAENGRREEPSGDLSVDAGFAAFISYRHSEPDKTIAERLHRVLESYRSPLKGDGRAAAAAQKPWRVFLDTAESQAGALSEQIRNGLRASRYLIVVCSPRIHQTPWVEQEVEEFLLHHPVDCVLPLLTEGEPESAFPCNLLARCRATFRGSNGTESAVVDRLGANIRAKSLRGSLGKLKTEKLRLLAPMLGVTYDQLFARDRRRRRQRQLRVTAICGSLLLTWLAWYGLSLTDWYQARAILAQKAPLAQIGAETRSRWLETLVRTGHWRHALDSLNGLKDEDSVDSVLSAMVQQGLGEQAVAALDSMTWYLPSSYTFQGLAQELTAAGRPDLALQVIGKIPDLDAGEAKRAQRGTNDFDVFPKRRLRLELLIDASRTGSEGVSREAFQKAEVIAAEIVGKPSDRPEEDINILLRLAGELWRQGQKDAARARILSALSLAARSESSWGSFDEKEPRATIEAIVDLGLFTAAARTRNGNESWDRARFLAACGPVLVRHGQAGAAVDEWSRLLEKHPNLASWQVGSLLAPLWGTPEGDRLTTAMAQASRKQNQPGQDLPELAKAMLEAGKPEAVEPLVNLLSGAEVSARSLAELCELMAEKKFAGPAIHCYRTAARLQDPQVSESYHLFIKVAAGLIALGDVEGALGAQARIPEKDRFLTDIETHSKISTALAGSGQWQRAEAALVEGYKQRVVVETHFENEAAFWAALGRLVDHDLAAGDVDGALRLARAFRGKEGDYAIAGIFGFMAEKLELSGRHQRAQEAYREEARHFGSEFLAWRLSTIGLWTEARSLASAAEQSLRSNPRVESEFEPELDQPDQRAATSWLEVAGALAVAGDERGAERAVLRSATETPTLADWQTNLHQCSFSVPVYLAAALGTKLRPLYSIVAVYSALAKAHRLEAFEADLAAAKKSAEWPALAFGTAHLLSSRPEDILPVRRPAPGTEGERLFASAQAEALFQAHRVSDALTEARVIPCGNRSLLLLGWAQDLSKAGQKDRAEQVAWAWVQALLEGPRQGLCEGLELSQVLEDLAKIRGLLDRELLRTALIRMRDRAVPLEKGEQSRNLFALAQLLARSGYLRDSRQTCETCPPEFQVAIDTEALSEYYGKPLPGE